MKRSVKKITVRKKWVSINAAWLWTVKAEYDDGGSETLGYYSPDEAGHHICMLLDTVRAK